MKKAIINILLVFFLGVLLYSGYRLYGIFSEYYKGRSEYKKTSSQYVTKKEESTEQEEKDGKKKKKVESAPIEVDFASLMKENEDVAGWIYCPDTVVDYPVMHGKDNDLYLHHMVNKEYNFAGCIFEDYRNTPGQKDPATILYGHHMKDGSMFHDLHRFGDAAFFDENQFLYIYTPEGNLAYEIFASYPFSNVDLMMCFDYSTPDAALIYFEGIWTNRSMTSHFRDNVALYGDSNIITMSTCIGGEPDMRYLVQAVLIE